MRATTYLFVNEPERAAEIRQLLNGVGLPVPRDDEGFFEIQAAPDTEELIQLRKAFRDAGIDWFDRREHLYSDEELMACPLLSLFVTSAEAGMGGPTHGTEYDLSDACPRCGTGARQTSALVLDASEVPTSLDLFETLDGEVLVSPSLKTALETGGLSGLELRQAIDHREGDALDWFQLILRAEMPPWDPSSVGYEREGSCRTCHRDGYFNDPNEPFEIAYAEPDLAGIADITGTYERFGNSVLREDFRKSHFAAPRLLISPRFLDILRNENVGNCNVLPVRTAD